MALNFQSPIVREKLKKIAEDPVLWAKAFVVTYDQIQKKDVPWTARWYQTEMLRDKSIRKVYLCGRRCLPEWVRIVDSNTGEWKTVRELYETHNASVVSMNPDNYSIVKQDNCPVSYNGRKEVFKVTTDNGMEIDATGNHPLFTVSGWKEISDLKPSDYIAVPSKINVFGHNHIPENDVKILAYMIGNGNCLNHNLRFSQDSSTKQFLEMKELVESYGCELKYCNYSNNPYDYSIVKKNEIHNKAIKNNVKKLLIRYNVYGHGANDKTIPKEIFMAPKEIVSLFLSRLYSTDGWASIHKDRQSNNIEIGYCSNSIELVRGIAHLLLRYGIHASIRKKDKAYIVAIHSRKDIVLFAENINIFGKENAIKKCVESALNKTSTDDYFPIEVNKKISKVMEEQNINLSDLTKMSDGQIMWQRIKSIRSIGIYPTYDLTVPKYHNFVANDIITHNTGKSETMVIEALWRTLTNRNFVHMFVTPYENQIRLLFDRMKELINTSPLLNPRMTRCVNHPYRIEFDNGSKIIGFTTGASSGSGGASLRGQRCDWISIDEMDYMNDSDFDTVTALCAERNDIGMTCSSTPTGARSRFYSICTDRKLGYSLHYHPSTHNPNWSKKMEEEFRAQLSESGYLHEIMAEFGDEEAGVFNKIFVDKAMTYDNYAYNQLTIIQRDRCALKNEFPTMLIPKPGESYPNNPFRTMGVDWDRRQADSSILILDYDREFERFRVLKRINFPKAEYTYDKAVQLIIELNETYNPSWIYADTGAGEHTNINI